MEKLLCLLCISLFASSLASNATEHSERDFQDTKDETKESEHYRVDEGNPRKMTTGANEDQFPDMNELLAWNDATPNQDMVALWYISIATVGLLANGVVFFVIFCGNEINKTVTAIYVVQLALADSVFLAALPFFASQQIVGWKFGSVACVICHTVKYLNYYAGIFFLTAMSIDRYIAVAYSTKAHQFRTRSRTAAVCTLVWLASIAGSLPAMLYSTTDQTRNDTFCLVSFPGYQKLNESEFEGIFLVVYGNDSEEFEFEYQDYADEISGSNETMDTSGWLCQHEHQPPSFYVNEVVKFVVGYVIPCGIITVSYLLIIKKLRSSEKKIKNRTGKRAHNMRKRVTRMVCALVICFAVCWLPYHVFTLMQFKGIYMSRATCLFLGKFVVVCGYANSVFNPILYTFLGHNFRGRLMESLRSTRTRMSRAMASGAFSRRSTHKSRSLSKRLTGRVTEAHRGSGPLTTGCEAESATVVTENQALRGGKRVPLIEMSIKKQAEVLWNCEPGQDEKSECLSRS